MSVVKVIEISAESGVSFEAAIQEGLDVAARTVDNIKSAWVKDQQVTVAEGKISSYRVYLKVTFQVQGS